MGWNFDRQLQLGDIKETCDFDGHLPLPGIM